MTVKITALVDTVIKRHTSDSVDIDDPNEKFDLLKGESLEANWIKVAANHHWQFELTTARLGFFNWFAFRSHVEIDGAVIPGPPTPGIPSQVKAFLDMISVPEGTSGSNGYRICFTGVLCVPVDFSRHPDILHTGGGFTSDAAGRYQFLFSTWKQVSTKLGLPDFSPNSQDKAAVELIRQRGVLSFVERGNVRKACTGTGGKTGVAFEWASLPPGRYGQPSISFERAEQLFVKFGGILGT